MTSLVSTRCVLGVRDLQASTQYYRDKLRMNLDFETPGWAFLSRDGFAIQLGECPDALPAGELGDHSYFAYVTVEDAQGLCAEFSAAGVEFMKHLTDELWGMREFGVRTIDGHRIMFGQVLD